MDRFARLDYCLDNHCADWSFRLKSVKAIFKNRRALLFFLPTTITAAGIPAAQERTQWDVFKMRYTTASYQSAATKVLLQEVIGLDRSCLRRG